MDGRSLILNPGLNEIELPGSEAGYADGVLWLYIKDVTFVEAFTILSNPANTSVIEFHYGEMVDRYEGLTHLTSIRDGEDLVSASLERGQDNVQH